MLEKQRTAINEILKDICESSVTVSVEPMKVAVTLSASGKSYEESGILQWLSHCDSKKLTCPQTKILLQNKKHQKLHKKNEHYRSKNSKKEKDQSDTVKKKFDKYYVKNNLLQEVITVYGEAIEQYNNTPPYNEDSRDSFIEVLRNGNKFYEHPLLQFSGETCGRLLLGRLGFSR